MYPVKHVWIVLIIKILQAHLLHAFVANLKIDAIYLESFCDKNLAIRKVFAFCDSGHLDTERSEIVGLNLENSHSIVQGRDWIIIGKVYLDRGTYWDFSM